LTWENLPYLYFRTEIVIWHPLFILLYLPVSKQCNAAAPSLCTRRGHITPQPMSEQQMRQGHAYAVMPPHSIGTDRLTGPSALSLADTNQIMPCRAAVQVIWFTRRDSCSQRCRCLTPHWQEQARGMQVIQVCGVQNV
jgi:hypothetical protein